MNYAPRLDETLMRNDPVQRPMEFCTVLREWLEEDFEGALGYLREMPRGNEYTEGVRMALEGLSSRDPERAVTLMKELVTRHEEMHLYNHVFARVVVDSPSAAVRLVDQVSDGEPRANAIRAVASVWSGTDNESALNWAVNLLAESDKVLAVESVLLARADDDPQGAIEFAGQYLKGESLRKVVERARTSSATTGLGLRDKSAM
jgi:hypothetical protein